MCLVQIHLRCKPSNGERLGSKLTLRLPEAWVKLIFGLLMAYVSFQLILAGYTGIQKDEP